MKDFLWLIGAWLLGCSTPAAAQDWLPATQWFFGTDQPRLYRDNVVYWGANIAGIPDNEFGAMHKSVWYQVDLSSRNVPPTATRGFLACEGIITGYSYSDGTSATQGMPAPILPQTTIIFRKPGDDAAHLADGRIFMGQLSAPLRGDGTRSNASWFVPIAPNSLEHAAIEYAAWWPDDIPQWDGTLQGGAAFGWNCSLQAWGQ